MNIFALSQSLRRFVTAVIGLAFACLDTGYVWAQIIDCNRLQQQIASLPEGADPTMVQRYREATRKQENELERATAQANSMGCGRRQFLFFGDAPPPQCKDLDNRIKNMQVNLDQLQGQLDRASQGNSDQRRALMDRYQTQCLGRAPSRNSGGSIFDTLFGNGPNRSTVPQNNIDIQQGDLPPPITDEPINNGVIKAICVRTCDGGFFPVSYHYTPDKNDRLIDLCRAQCPNTEVLVFTYAEGQEIDKATGIDGRPYTTLANAGRFKTKYEPSCGCKKPDQSWVDALANAEKVLSGGTGTTGDFIVSPQKALEMSKPIIPSAKPAAKGKTPAKDAKGAPDVPVVDPGTPAQQGAEPTLIVPEGNGPSAGTFNAPKTIGLDQGKKEDEINADGTKRRVRIIAPTL
jgi:Protein of unknown function (DUF2865)